MALTATGGTIPELDSHAPGPNNPTAVDSRFSPWHACGSQYEVYSATMERSDHLALGGCVLRLRTSDSASKPAARQWEHVFCVACRRDSLAFVNARLRFASGGAGKPEGLASIMVRVHSRQGQARSNAGKSEGTRRLCRRGHHNVWDQLESLVDRP
jgi:hypothetical protein